MGRSPWSCKELGTTERLTLNFLSDRAISVLFVIGSSHSSAPCPENKLFIDIG